MNIESLIPVPPIHGPAIDFQKKDPLAEARPIEDAAAGQNSQLDITKQQITKKRNTAPVGHQESRSNPAEAQTRPTGAHSARAAGNGGQLNLFA